ncbi:divalent-cation tolerance protein CutA [Mariprofundus sp. EBB-1]|uniref:divalent-cation tolerance protein CutA n=1 Tax=Mariprofundus sp. EBB-1 TaxID=2650971 RepID=UPI000EF273C9|nr:divalent-cation tolerance protein CutA [Mariprofundus sp. EBB-1]RLL51567.1 divalent-cation tolerance protein CutA [Mariprofundus sp. EBB-1]
MQKICIIHTSVCSRSEASLIATTLIDLKLCACVQMTGPGISTYRWKGKVEQAEEYYLSIKTNINHKDRVLEWLHQVHPYELPEITWDLRDCSAQYTEWVDSEVG